LAPILTSANCSCLLIVLTGSWQLLSGLLGAPGDTYTQFPVRSLSGAYMSPGPSGTLGTSGPLGPSGLSGLSVQLGQLK
jgi:hypothetical protein